MRGPAAFIAVALLTTPIAWADRLCIAPAWNCVEVAGESKVVTPSERERAYVWRRSEPRETILGIVTAGAGSVALPESATSSLTFRVAGQKNRGWPAACTILVAGSGAEWTWTRDAADAASPERIRLSRGGVYRLTARADHHRTLTYPNIAVGSKPVDLGLLTLAPVVRITGKVVARKREPVPGAWVTLPDGTRLGTSDEAGVFALETEAVPRALVVSAPPFADRLLPMTHGGPNIDTGEILLRKGVTLIGSVVRPRSAAPTPLDIDLFEEWGIDRALRRVRSVHLAKEQDIFRVEALAPARYVALVKGPTPLQQFTSVIDVDQPSPVEKTLRIEPLAFRLHVAYGGHPLPDAGVTIYSEGRLERRVWKPAVITDSDGNVEGELWQRRPLMAEVRHVAIDAVVPADRDVGEDDVDWTIRIPRQRIIGVVRDAEGGQPIAGARVHHDYAGDDGISLSRMSRLTDAAGAFVFDAAGNGTHTLTVEAAGYRRAEPLVIRLRDVEERRADIRLVRGNTLRLSVFDASGTPAASARVVDGYTESGTAARRILSADESGELLLGGSDDELHRLCVIPLSGSFSLLTVKTGKDSPPDVLVRVPPAIGSLRIEVATPDGQPLANLRFMLRYNGEFIPPGALSVLAFRQRRSSATDLEGVFFLDAVPEGTYEIWPFATDLEAERIQSSPSSPPATVRVRNGEADVRIVVAPRSG